MPRERIPPPPPPLRGGRPSPLKGEGQGRANSARPLLAMTEPESMARSQNLQRRKHRLGDIGSAVPAAEFHRLDALGINLVDGALDTLAGFRPRLPAPLVRAA